MALVACPECGKEVSSHAASCPHCGLRLQGPAGMPPLAVGAPPGPETVLWEGVPSALLVVGQGLRAGLALVLRPLAAYLVYRGILFFLGPVATRGGGLVPSHPEIALGLGAVVALSLVPTVFSLFATLARVKSLHYTLTTQRLLVEKGVFSRTLQEIDLRYVDETQFVQAFFERILGIGEVRVVSSDKVAPNVVLLGLKDPRSIREKVRAQAYAVSQRQFFTRST